MTRIVFKELQVGSVANTSGIFHGNNRQSNWVNRTKVNEGFGELVNNNPLEKSYNLIVDSDCIDTIISKKEGSNLGLE